LDGTAVTTRDQLAQELGILCSEMETGDLMDTFPCLVILRIYDDVRSYHGSRQGWNGDRYRKSQFPGSIGFVLSMMGKYMVSPWKTRSETGLLS
jgi:hypothetical protein